MANGWMEATWYNAWNYMDNITFSSGGGPRVVVSTAAFHARVRGSVPGLGGLKETKMFLPHPRVKVSIVGSLRDREVACSASDRQSSHSSHHPQEVLLAQFSLYVHKGGLKPDSFHFIFTFSSVVQLVSCGCKTKCKTAACCKCIGQINKMILSFCCSAQRGQILKYPLYGLIFL